MRKPLYRIDLLPDRFIGWNVRLGFHDLRVVAAQRLASALRASGLAHLIDTERWILDMPDRLCAGCVFSDGAWQAKLDRDAWMARERKRWKRKR